MDLRIVPSSFLHVKIRPPKDLNICYEFGIEIVLRRVVQYTQTAANRQRQLTNRQTGSRFAAKWCCDTGGLRNHLL